MKPRDLLSRYEAWLRRRRPAFYLIGLAVVACAVYLDHRNGYLPWPTIEVKLGEVTEAAPDVYAAKLVTELRKDRLQGELVEARPVHVTELLSPLLGAKRVHAVVVAILKARFRNLMVPRESALAHDRSGADAPPAGTFRLEDGAVRFLPADRTDPRANNRTYVFEAEPLVPRLVISAFKLLAYLLGIPLLSLVVLTWLWPAVVAGWLWPAVLRVWRSPLLAPVRSRSCAGAGVLARLGRRYRGTGLGLAISAATFVVLLWLAEIVLIPFIPFTEPHWPSRFDQRFGYNFDPDQTVRWTNNADFWTATEVNSLGFLDREPEIPKPEGTFRILVVGDSFVEAAQVRIEEKVQVLLADRLNERFPDRRFDGVAFGYSGTGQTNQLSFYDAFGPDVDPDLVILLFVSNDLANNSLVLESIRNGMNPDHSFRHYLWRDAIDEPFTMVKIDPRWNHHLLETPDGSLEKQYHARMLELARDPRFGPLLEGWNYPKDLDMDGMFFVDGEMPPVFEEAVAATSETLRLFKERARRDGFVLLLVASETMTSKLSSKYRPMKERGQMERLEAMAAVHGLPLLDLYPHFSSHDKPEEAHFRFDSHWSPTGHRWAAEDIVRYLLEHPEMLGRDVDPPGG